jgi:N-acetylglutamate synthase-like GNAT family acetyltransferase
MVDEQQWLDEMKEIISNYKNTQFSIKYPDCKIDYFIKENSIISFSDLSDFSENHIYLRDLYIAENCRQIGLGKELINGLLVFAKEVGHNRIETEPISSSIGFFLKLGFKWMSDERMYLNF